MPPLGKKTKAAVSVVGLVLGGAPFVGAEDEVDLARRLDPASILPDAAAVHYAGAHEQFSWVVEAKVDAADLEQEVVARKAIGALMSGVNPIRAVNPINRIEQRERFLAGEIENPEFQYERFPNTDVDRVSSGLGDIVTPETSVGALLDAKIKRAQHKVLIAGHAGDADVVRRATEAIYGRPSPDLLEAAEVILASVQPRPAGATVPASTLKEAFEEEVAGYELDWDVVQDDVASVSVNASKRRITVPQQKDYPAEAVERLLVHEIGVHVLRGANGATQPKRFKVLATGLPGFMTTEEGLATYREYAMGMLDANTLRKYAARVVAVSSVLSAEDFGTTFERLRGYGFDENDAWDTTVRVHRGGGYIKDHIYLQGLLDVIRYVAAGGDVADLYVGKIALAHVDWSQSLVDAGQLKAPTHLPRDPEGGVAEANIAELLEGLAVGPGAAKDAPKRRTRNLL